MRRASWASLISALSLTTLALGCGQDAGIRFANAGLSAETQRLVVYYFEASAMCSALWMSSDRSSALHGPFASDELDDDERAEGFDFPSRDIPSGTYVVVVDALDAADTLIGSGCAEGQQVLEQRSSFTEIVVYPVE